MSERQILKDRYDNRIGEIETFNGKQILWDKFGVRLGEYNIRDDLTYDRFGVRIGTGNLLTSLLRL